MKVKNLLVLFKSIRIFQSMKQYTERLERSYQNREMIINQVANSMMEQSLKNEDLYSFSKYFPADDVYNYRLMIYSIYYKSGCVGLYQDLGYLTSKPLSFECFYINTIAGIHYKNYNCSNKEHISLTGLLKDPSEVLSILTNKKKDKKCKIAKEKDPILTKYNKYITRCKTKNRLFDLSLDTFKEIINKPCVYCGISPAKTVDRIDSSKGYIEGNTQPCCNTCNTMKWDASEKVFLDHIRRIYNHVNK